MVIHLDKDQEAIQGPTYAKWGNYHYTYWSPYNKDFVLDKQFLLQACTNFATIKCLKFMLHPIPVKWDLDPIS